jgi:hypothetical protein
MLRAELHYRLPELSRLARLRDLLIRIESLPANAEGDDIELFRALSGKPYTLDDIRSYNSSMTAEDFLLIAAQPAPVRFHGLSRDELADIVRRAMNSGTEAETQYYLALFDAQVEMPTASALIYQPPDDWHGDVSDWDPTPHEVVDLALSYRPIAL